MNVSHFSLPCMCVDVCMRERLCLLSCLAVCLCVNDLHVYVHAHALVCVWCKRCDCTCVPYIFTSCFFLHREQWKAVI